MSKKTWLEKNLDKVQVIPDGWPLIFRTLDEFVGVVDLYANGAVNWPTWIVLVMQTLTDAEDLQPQLKEKILRQVQALIQVRLDTGQWGEVDREQQ